VFGDMAIPGMDKDIKDAMKKGTSGIENIFGSQASLRGRKVNISWLNVVMYQILYKELRHYCF